MPAVLYYSFPPAQPLTGNEIIGPVLQNGYNVTVTIEDIASLAAAYFSVNSNTEGVLNADLVNISGPLTVGGALSGATADFSGNVTIGGALSGTAVDLSGDVTVGGAQDPFILTGSGIMPSPGRTHGALAQYFNGVGVQTSTNFGADANPMFVVATNDRTFVLQAFNGGHIVTLKNTLDDGSGNATINGALNVADGISLYTSGLPTVGGSGLAIGPTVSGQAAALFVNAPTGYSNDLLSVGVNGTPVGSIDQYGNLTIKGSITSNGVTQGSSSSNISGLPASITNTTGTTLPASDMINGAIIRTGPTSDFSDTTDTAANIIASFGPSPPVGSSYQFVLINQTDYSDTLIAGAGVTIKGSGIIAPNNALTFRVTITDTTSGSQAVTLTRLFAGGT